MKMDYVISYTTYKPLSCDMIKMKDGSRTRFEKDLKEVLAGEPDAVNISISVKKGA